LRSIESLLHESDLSESDAAALVGVKSLDDLTGGVEGTASALIHALKKRAQQSKSGQS
jgi:hypothetical protein